MPATDPQTLFSNANSACYANANPGDWALFKLALLQQIVLALNPMAATDPQSLLASVTCYNCGYNWALLELALLQLIAQNGAGGGGGGSVITGASANPNTASIKPSVMSQGAIYYQVPSDGTGSDVWTWDTLAQTWVQFSV